MASEETPELSLPGGGRGIGKEIALTLARAGADVIVAARTVPDLNQTVDDLVQIGRRGLAVQVDITRVEQVKGMVTSVMDQFGRIDILVNNAGFVQTKPIVEMPGLKSRLADMTPEFSTPTTPEDWALHLQTNLTGAFLVTQAVCPHMMQAKKGKIVNITSVEPMRPGSFHTPYSTTKWGLLGMTRSLALELARYNINVNAVGPGYIYTDMTKFYYEDPNTRDALLKQVPLRKFGSPRDVALAVLFLASDASDFITGHQIPLDGGFHI